MMSEKAQGKQRAASHSTPDSASSAAAAAADARPTLELVIRFTDGETDLALQIDEADTVTDTKAAIRRARPHLRTRRLRLIHAGKILPDATAVCGWLRAVGERQHRPAVEDDEDEERERGQHPPAPAIPPALTWLHCAIGPPLEDGEKDDTAQTAQLRPLRGFDRLAAAGFSEEDIAGIRRQFHNQSAANFLDSGLETEEDYDEHARVLEEQWIDSMDNPGSVTLSDATTSSSMLQGVVLGFFFPLLPLFFFRESHPAVFWNNGREQEPQGTVIFSKRMQMGIVLGFSVNVLFGMWKYLLGSSS